MKPVRLFLGLVVFVAAATGRADDKAKKPPPPIHDDLAKLQGTWQPVGKPEKGGSVSLEFGKELRSGKHYLNVTHSISGGGGMLNVGNQVVLIELKQDGNKRLIAPKENNERVSRIVYRLDGDRLVIEEGECTVHDKISLKGEWKRLKGERVP
jgi:hypothetical protein